MESIQSVTKGKIQECHHHYKKEGGHKCDICVPCDVKGPKHLFKLNSQTVCIYISICVSVIQTL